MAKTFITNSLSCFRAQFEGGLLILGGFKPRVSGADPQIGYVSPGGNMQDYLNLQGYQELAAESRPEGWNAWRTFAISPAAAHASVGRASKLLHK
jgi:hypothetical protein